MAQRRTSHRAQPSTNVPLTRRKNLLHRSPASRLRAFERLHHKISSATVSCSSTSADSVRPVLVTLHPNLRRLPSRSRLVQKNPDDMRNISRGSHASVQAGVKRKRVASCNENAQRSARSLSRSKRLRSSPSSRSDYTSDEGELSSMQIDTPCSVSDGSDRGEEDEEEEEEEEQEAGQDNTNDSSDDYLITEAPANQLLRLRKDNLIRLYTAAGLSDDVEALTKLEITDAIIAARDDVASLPPSSPPGRGDGNSSEYSSDDGNVAGDEDTDFSAVSRSAFGLRRRATINDLGKSNGRPSKNRSLSMGNISGNGLSKSTKKTVETGGQINGGSPSRRKTSRTSPPTLPAILTHLPSPPITRLRTRKASGSAEISTPISGPSSGSGRTDLPQRGKGKAKQVEFDDEVQVRAKPPSQKAKRAVEVEQMQEDESDLTELEELEAQLLLGPSPRRLRSKDKGKESENARPSSSGAKSRRSANEVANVDFDGSRRVTPMRKAKKKIGSLKEEDDDDDEDELDDHQVAQPDSEDEVRSESQDDDGADEEIDELVSSASASPSPAPPVRGRKTPVKRRLRPRRVVQTHTPPSDGDDEEEDDEAEVDADTRVDEDEDEEGADLDADEDADADTIVAEPRKLRNGKIVGEEEMEVDEDVEEEAEEDADDNEDAESVDADDIDIDAEGDTDEDEALDDEAIDLTAATAKTLVRLRRDDLVRLCESRDLDVAGTKPQLAAALLQWRDQHTDTFSSPSSAGTVRPQSTVKRRGVGRRHSNQHESPATTPPVLMRSHRFHQDEPRTPPASEHKKEAEPELELDLESLGLEDREIPPDKLTKLDRIGSGGFKDVFIGKFKGRKVAISEFRGQLSAMDIKELKLLGGFDHPNIVRFLGVSIPENTRDTPVMIVSELCSNGDLFDYVRNVNPPSLYKVLCMMLDIARGLEYLHLRKPSVIHRDCKSSNILITSKGVAKIADFGLAKVKQSTRSMVRSLVGTVNWQAPELWHAHPKYNHKVDVFSCAMVYWEMLQWHLPNKKYPWEGMNEHAIYDAVGAKKQRPSISGLKKQWSPEIVQLIERMWAQEHQDRPTMSEVVEELEQMVHR